MTKIVVSVFIILLFVFSKPLAAQTISTFEQGHNQLLNEYVAFIDSVEKKQPISHRFEIFKNKHTSRVDFTDNKLVYRITKKVKIYKDGVRYEKIDWTIRYPHKAWHHKIYEIKQVGNDYRFLEQTNYEFGKKLKQTKITTSFDDNYLLIKVLNPKGKTETYFYTKPNSSLPRIHQD